ncbi:MAG: hypothetical protein RSE41_00775 [Clostridia bacterium]
MLDYGDYALSLLINGNNGYIVGVEDNKLIKTKYPKERIPRLLDFKNNDLILASKNMGISFGE